MSQKKENIAAFSPLITALAFILLIVIVQQMTNIQAQKIYTNEKKEIKYAKQHLTTNPYKAEFWYSFDSLVIATRDTLLKRTADTSSQRHIIDSTRAILSISSGYLAAKENNAVTGTLLFLLLFSLLFVSVRTVKGLSGEFFKRKWFIGLISSIAVVDICICIYLSTDISLVHNIAGSLTEPVKQFDKNAMILLGIVLPDVAVICVSAFLLGISTVLLSHGSTDQHIVDKRTKFMKNSLYLTSTALGVAVLSTYLQYGWSSIIVENGNSVESAARSLSIASGVLFSIIILLIYLPLWMQDKRGNGPGPVNPAQTPPAQKWQGSELAKDIIVALIPCFVSIALQLFGFKGAL